MKAREQLTRARYKAGAIRREAAKFFALLAFFVALAGCSSKSAGTQGVSAATGPGLTTAGGGVPSGAARAPTPGGGPQLAQGNGSSGIGNAVPVVGDLQTQVATPNSIRVDHDTIVDAKTGEKLLRVEEVQQGPETTASENLVPAKLGRVDGLEFVPFKGTDDSGHWVVCGQSGKPCYKLSPLSTTNPKVAAIIGSLSRAQNR